MNQPQYLTGLIGGVLGSILTQVFASVRYVWNKKNEGRFAALSLALILEAYASECADPILELDAYADHPRNAPEPSGTIALLSDYPQTNWRNLGERHAIALLTYRVTVQAARRQIAFTAEMEGSASAWNEAGQQGLKLGVEAVRIAKELRKSFKLPPADVRNGFDIDDFFKLALAKLNGRKAE